MKRDIQRLMDEEFDLLILGAGIYGAATAWEAASRGLSVALIDKGDFGGLTSANSLKTIHGGIRYLQTLGVDRFRESVKERRALLKIAPHFVSPMCCIMPTCGHFMKSRPVLKMGLLLNDILSLDRNWSLDEEKRIPRSRTISREECLSMLIGINGTGLTGGAMWTDAQMISSERLVLSFILSAEQAGAVPANYVEAIGFLRTSHRIFGVMARDLLSQKEFGIHAKMTLNMTGGFFNSIMKKAVPETSCQPIQLSTAMNLVLRKSLLPGCAAGVFSRFVYLRPSKKPYKGTRVLFFAPWRGFTIVGTHHRPYEDEPENLRIREKEVDTFLEEVQHAYPGGAIQKEDVCFWHKGFLPMDGVKKKSGEVILTKHYRIYDHEREDGVEGFLGVAGVKYTTARGVAKKVIDLVLKRLRRDPFPSKTHKVPIWGGDIRRFENFKNNVMEGKAYGLSPKVLQYLVHHYGAEYPSILSYLEEKSQWGELVSGSEEVILAEIIHAVREEMAVKLSDVILRRTALGAGGHPGENCLKVCASIMAKELGWNEKRKEQEILETSKIYTLAK